VISLHVVGESNDVLILAFLLGLFGSGNVELAGRVGNMRDLCVVRLRSLGETMPEANSPTAASAAANLRDTIGTLLWRKSRGRRPLDAATPKRFPDLLK